MKQVVLIIGLCIVTIAAFAQKAAVTGAERMAKDSRANFNEARKLIGGALEHAETKDDAKTWFVAGQVEDAQFNAENTKQIIGQQPNEPVMYTALGNTLPFFLKAYELDQRPDEKGKIKPKYDKSIKGILGANHIYYLNAGGYYFTEQQDYQKAYDFFEQFMDIANLTFMAGTKTAVRDSNYLMVQFYAAVAAIVMDNNELAVKALIRAKDSPFRQDDVYQYLTGQYEILQDSVNVEKTLTEGLKLFPDTSFYLINLSNIYISSGRNEQAVDMLNTIIAKNPTNAQLYQAMGSVYERGYKDNDKAEANYLKALELDPDNHINHSNVGRVYYNQAVNKLNEANLITDSKLYNEEKEKVKQFFEKARPYFEKAHQMAPKEGENLVGLRGIYYNLLMSEELDKIEKEMEALYGAEE